MADVLFPEYHKINALYKRDDRGRFTGEFSRPEFEYLYYCDWLCTEKVDGTNIRIAFNAATRDIKIGGRTDNAQLPVSLVERLGDVTELIRASDAFDPAEGEPDPDCWTILYGEGYGQKIQKGGGNYHADRVDFVLFDVLVRDLETGNFFENTVKADWWLRRDDVVDIAAQLGIDVVPEVARCTLEEAEKLVAEGFDSSWGPFPAEGVVATPVVPLFARDRKRVITKLKTKDYAHAKEEAKAIPFPIVASGGECIGYPPRFVEAA